MSTAQDDTLGEKAAIRVVCRSCHGGVVKTIDSNGYLVEKPCADCTRPLLSETDEFKAARNLMVHVDHNVFIVIMPLLDLIKARGL